MKKYTILVLTFLVGTMAFSQDNLLENGDFEDGMIVWFGNAFNVQTDGGNSYNFADIQTAGEPFDVNLSQGLEIVQGETYTLEFEASTDADTGSRTIIAGIGLNEAPWTANTESVTLTSTNDTFTLTFTASFGLANSRVLFDMGAETGIVVIDNVSLIQGGGSDPVTPETAAPTPPSRAEDAVFSIFSDAYENQPNVVFGAFDVGTLDIETIQIEGDNTQQIQFIQPDLGFVLVDWGLPVDNTAMTHFHMDYWTATDLQTGLIANPKWSNHVGDAGETSAFELTNPVTTFGEWVSIDVPLADFDAGDPSQQRDALRQFVLTVVGADNGARTVFVDNIYLHNNTLSTEEFTAIDVNVYPNPSEDRWTFTANSDIITSIELYDVLGKRISIETPGSPIFDINASNLKNGIYIAHIATTNGRSTVKLIKK